MNQMSVLSPNPRLPQQMWNDEEEVEYLIELYRKNLTFDFIADTLDRDIGSVRYKIVALHKAGRLEKRSNIQVVLRKKRDEYIRRNLPIYGFDYCVRHLGIAPKTVETSAYRMGLKVA